MHVYASRRDAGNKVQCEMGGKNPIVVLEDADLELAVAATAQGAFGSTGQRCTATSRAIVIDADRGRVRRARWRSAREARVGDPLAEGVDMGPSVDAGRSRRCSSTSTSAGKRARSS